MFLVPQGLILAACIYFITKRVSAEGILLLTASFLEILFYTFEMLVLPYLYKNNTIPLTFGPTSLYNILSIVHFFIGLVFAIGFFMLIYQVIKKKNMNPGKDGLTS